MLYPNLDLAMQMSSVYTHKVPLVLGSWVQVAQYSPLRLAILFNLQTAGQNYQLGFQFHPDDSVLGLTQVCASTWPLISVRSHGFMAQCELWIRLASGADIAVIVETVGPAEGPYMREYNYLFRQNNNGTI